MRAGGREKERREGGKERTGGGKSAKDQGRRERRGRGWRVVMADDRILCMQM